MSFKYTENHHSSSLAEKVAAMMFCIVQHCSVDKGNKDFLFGDSPSTESTKLEQSLHGRHVLGQKRKQAVTSAPHTWLEASSVLALDVAGETCILVPGWEGSSRGGPRETLGTKPQP